MAERDARETQREKVQVAVARTRDEAGGGAGSARGEKDGDGLEFPGVQVGGGGVHAEPDGDFGGCADAEGGADREVWVWTGRAVRVGAEGECEGDCVVPGFGDGPEEDLEW